ncbi:iron chelate uptake ABC transporter family permease subunit [Nocardioides sp. TF02-7]|uniref:FecCD family ABC transporter permease n=1 Tax=Nocardioides sp. TF02-7 TaxID=2917724 RepID=UPI001F0709A1|nr:iron chelate uptake ABC transporter family permease subunit [Nocardioides sp. TF02-7]UMG94374.1 iron chelate uptake ABC transporter family permease subunit [Nocardioides sp. TF02-7]
MTTLLSTPRYPVGVLRVGRLSVAVPLRPLVVCLGLVVAVVGAGTASLVLGEVQVGLPRVWLTLTGEGLPIEELIVQDYRLPRVFLGVLVGAALAMSGALFQTITRNPLGSPDVIGFEAGAASGGLVALLALDTGLRGAAVGAVVAGALTAGLVYLLAMRGGVDPLRLVLVGIGVGAMLLSLNALMITSSTVYDAQAASVWLVGSLEGSDWSAVRLLAVAVVAGGAAALLLSRPLRMAELTDDSAAGLGLATGRVRFLAVAVGVLLSAVAVAAAGPVAFIALSAPQVARRLTRAGGPNLVASALTGALLLVLADHAARELFQPRLVAVGVMTGLVGGLYLAWLLTLEWRKGRL